MLDCVHVISVFELKLKKWLGVDVSYVELWTQCRSTVVTDPKLNISLELFLLTFPLVVSSLFDIPVLLDYIKMFHVLVSFSAASLGSLYVVNVILGFPCMFFKIWHSLLRRNDILCIPSSMQAKKNNVVMSCISFFFLNLKKKKLIVSGFTVTHD